MQDIETTSDPVIYAEAALLSTIINSKDNAVFLRVYDKLKPNDFIDNFHKRLYTFISLAVIRKNLIVDKAAVLSKLKQKGLVTKFNELLTITSSVENLEFFIKEISNASKLRKLRTIVNTSLIEMGGENLNVEEIVNNIESGLLDISGSSKSEYFTTSDLITNFLENLRQNKHETGLTTSIESLDELLNGIPMGFHIIAARPSVGKALTLDSKILLENGKWTTMGEIKVGDRVASIDGTESIVEGVFPQGKKEVFEVEFSDGRKVRACAEHLWKVRFRHWKEDKILTTQKIMSMLERYRYKKRLSIDLISGDFGYSDNLPIDPYVLGVLLGDGCITNSTPKISNPDPEIMLEVGKRLGNTAVVMKSKENRNHCDEYLLTQKTATNIITTPGYIHGKYSHQKRVFTLIRDLKNLGLYGKKSPEKFVPDIYLNASYTDRLDILRGLLDTDGWVEKNGTVQFSSSSKMLSENVVYLVRSLGGTGYITIKQTKFTYKGETKIGLPAYLCHLRHRSGNTLFLLGRKSKRAIRIKHKEPRLSIKSIIPISFEETKCISVSNSSHLYITNDFIVTHNTEYSLNILEHNASNNKLCAFFSLEMDEGSLTERLLSSVSGVPLQHIKKKMISNLEMSAIETAIKKIESMPIIIDTSKGITASDIAAKARRLKIKFPELSLIIIDYIQLISGTNNKDSQEAEVSKISHILKNLQGTLKIPIIALSQLSRNVENREDKRPRLSDLRSSGALEQNCDICIFLYSDAYYNDRENRAPDVEFIVAKNRNGPTGMVLTRNLRETQRFVQI